MPTIEGWDNPALMTNFNCTMGGGGAGTKSRVYVPPLITSAGSGGGSPAKGGNRTV